jgi:uridine phosphorylase
MRLKKDESIVTADQFVTYMAELKGWRPEDLRIEDMVILDLSNGRRLTSLLKDATKARPIEKSIYKDAHLFIGKIGGIKVTLFQPIAFGAPAITSFMEELIARGAKKILLLGAAGSLQPYLKVGDYVIPSDAIRGEGVSYYYLPKGVQAKASKGIVNALEKACRKHRVKYRKGLVWTMDAPFRELKSKVIALQRQGCLAVEMETAAVFSVAAFRGIEAGAFLCISDELAKLKWKLEFYSKKLQSAEERMIDIVIDALRVLEPNRE